MPISGKFRYLSEKCPIRDRIFLESFFNKNNIDTGSDFELLFLEILIFSVFGVKVGVLIIRV